MKGRLHRFLLPAHTSEVRILSHGGVRLDAILVDGRIIGLDSPALVEGFHPPQRSGAELWRSTDSVARLMLPARFGHSGSVLLELLLHDGAPGRPLPRMPAEMAQAA